MKKVLLIVCCLGLLFVSFMPMGSTASGFIIESADIEHYYPATGLAIVNGSTFYIESGKWFGVESGYTYTVYTSKNFWGKYSFLLK